MQLPYPQSHEEDAFRRIRNLSKKLALLICDSLLWSLPRKPIDFAIIRIVRHDDKLPDTDNLTGGLKPLIDCLVTNHNNRHPNGLGLITDDNAARLILQVMPRMISAGEKARTTVTILELDPLHAAMKRRFTEMAMTERQMSVILNPLTHVNTPRIGLPLETKLNLVTPPGIIRMTAAQYRTLKTPGRKNGRAKQ